MSSIGYRDSSLAAASSSSSSSSSFASSSSSSSSSTSPSSSPIHPASLIDPSKHSHAILDLVDLKISTQVIDYLIDCVVETVNFAIGRPSSPKRRFGRQQHHHSPELASFITFVSNVLSRAEVSMPTLLGALVYIDRAKPHLHIALEEWAHERVFLGALVCAAKYFNDSTLKNVHWALCTGVFGKRDVGRIEREFLDVLDFELGVSEEDFLSHHEGLMAATRPPRTHRLRSFFRRGHPSPTSPTTSCTALAPPFVTTCTTTSTMAVPVPELTPYSPGDSSSSPSSASPATPSSPRYAAPEIPSKQHSHSVSSNTTHFHSHHDSETLDLLRAFPMPAAPPVNVNLSLAVPPPMPIVRTTHAQHGHPISAF